MNVAEYKLIARAQAFLHLIHGAVFTDLNHIESDLEEGLLKFSNLLVNNRNTGGNIYLIGNGGSAAVASHATTDFVNMCHLRAFILHDAPLMTCMSNDYGYDQAYKKILNTLFTKKDILIAISSSGKSANICHAAKAAKIIGGTVITLTGFKKDNILSQCGDLNFWLNVCDYGLVEIGHLFFLHNVAEKIALMGKDTQFNVNIAI